MGTFAALAALLVGWLLAGLDSRGLDRAESLSPWAMLAVLTGLWTLWSLGGAVFAMLVWSAWPSGPARGRVTSGLGLAPMERFALRAGGAALVGLALHCIGLLQTGRSTETLVIGVTLAAVVLVPLCGAAQGWLARRISDLRPGRRRGAFTAVVGAVAVAALWMSVILVHEDYLRELLRDVPFGSGLLVVPLLVALVVGRLVSRVRLGAAPGSAQGDASATESAPREGGAVVGPVQTAPVATRPADWARAHGVARMLLATLAIAGLAVGVLGARTATPEQARALRDTAGLWSGPLVRTAFALGVPTPPLGAAQGLRGCTPGAALGAPGSVGTAPADAPDILLITIDGLRLDHTSLLQGSEHPNTPHLLARAGQGAVFTRAYTPAPSTRAAFRSIFTGLLPGQVDAPPAAGFPWALTLSPAQPTLAAYLREAGYETVALVSKPKAFPVASHALTGFAEVDDAPAEYHLRHRHSAQLKVSRIIGRLAVPPSHAVAPRFVWTHLIEPHYPYTRGPMHEAAPDPRDQEARHDLAVRYVDEQLERLLRFALAPERRDRTIVIITSDHGEAFDEHRNARHGATVYEEELRVPLVVLGGGVRPGTHDAPVSLVELLPTVLGLAGLEAPEGLCGEGFMRTLRAGTPLPDTPLYAAALPDGTTRYHQLAFLVGGEKLIVDGETGSSVRYDLAQDPDERAPDTSSPATRALRTRFERFLADRGLPSPFAD